MAVGTYFVGSVQRAYLVGPGIGFQFNDIFVDEGHLYSPGFQPSEWKLLPGHAGEVGHVVVDNNKFLHQASDDVQIAPLLGVDVAEMKLPYDLVDIVQVLEGEVLESRPLPSLAVYFDEYVLLQEAINPQHVFQGVEDFSRCYLGPFAHADVVEVVVVLIEGAGGSEGVGAVVLVVGHGFLLGQLAS